MSKTNKQIGIGIVTCNRLNYLVKTLQSLYTLQNDIELIIINDGDLFDTQKQDFRLTLDPDKIHNNEFNEGVGKSKNKALKHLLNKKCEHIFLLEDDVVIKDTNILNKYIEASKISGIQHFNFAFHGLDNRTVTGQPAIRLKIDYSKDVSVCLYPNVYGALSYYTKKCLDLVGLMDEFYYNAVEHVDHTNTIINIGMHPPFRWFADIADSDKYIEEIDYAHSGSQIRRDEKWINNFHKSADYFAKKNGFDIRVPYPTNDPKELVIEKLKEIKQKYGQK
jgi:hypothetical protein